MSKGINLTPLEVKDLIRKYKSELRKLEFQSHKIQSTIEELEASLPEEDAVLATVQMTTAEGDVAPKAAKSGKAKEAEKPKAKSKAAPKPKKGRKVKGAARPKKEKGQVTRQTRLNEWDQFVLDTIEKAGQAMINPELQEAIEKSDQFKVGEEKISTKLNQTLHKLANKKKLLKKVKHSGRGYAYALSSWMTSKGELPKKYQR